MKLTITLEEADLNLLKEHLASQIPILTGDRSTAVTRILSTLTEVLETDALVDAKVTALLAQLTNIPPEIIKNEHKLSFHLGLGPTRIKALAGPLTLIAQSIKANAKNVTISEASKLDTVQSCIDLVKKKF